MGCETLSRCSKCTVGPIIIELESSDESLFLWSPWTDGDLLEDAMPDTLEGLVMDLIDVTAKRSFSIVS